MANQSISDTGTSAREGEERDSSGQTVYLVRHCRAAGGGPDTPLSEEGERQAQALAEWFTDRGVRVRQIVSSPLTRAVQSATPLARWAGVPVETDERLRERVLSTPPVPHWKEPTVASFADPDLCLPGGESSRQAADRVLAVLEGALKQGKANRHSDGAVVLITHGQPLAQLLRALRSCVRVRRVAGADQSRHLPPALRRGRDPATRARLADLILAMKVLPEHENIVRHDR